MVKIPCYTLSFFNLYDLPPYTRTQKKKFLPTKGIMQLTNKTIYD